MDIIIVVTIDSTIIDNSKLDNGNLANQIVRLVATVVKLSIYTYLHAFRLTLDAIGDLLGLCFEEHQLALPTVGAFPLVTLLSQHL